MKNVCAAGNTHSIVLITRGFLITETVTGSRWIGEAVCILDARW
nr:MAG TPA: hypothetical protein [Caudoviricetes sp.]